MKFGRVHPSQLSALDLSLPADPPQTTRFLQGLPKPTGRPDVRLGCPVWGHKGFVGTVYPAKTPQREFLREYGKQFNTIELNSTHYNVPSPELVQRWCNSVPESFKFCPKFPQRISHRSKIDEPLEITDRFLEALLEFGPRLGSCFIQLPPWFGPDGLERLHRFLASLPQDLKLSVELRHPDWFADPVAGDEVFGMFETLGVGALITDVAGRRDVCHMRVTGTELMIRFTGDNLHPTDYPRAEAWAKRLAHWLELGLPSLYFLLHQPEEENCGEMAVHFLDALKAETGIEVPKPVLYHKQQQELF